jgi:hypothetical protein
VVSNLILKSVLHAIVNPHFINRKLYDLFSPETSPILFDACSHPSSGSPFPRYLSDMKPVPLLSGCDVNKNQRWALASKLADVLQSPEIFKPFQHYMIQQNGLPFLLFCLDVEASLLMSMSLPHMLQAYIQELQEMQIQKETADEATIKRLHAQV